jgi:hypothetical protein
MANFKDEYFQMPFALFRKKKVSVPGASVRGFEPGCQRLLSFKLHLHLNIYFISSLDSSPSGNSIKVYFYSRNSHDELPAGPTHRWFGWWIWPAILEVLTLPEEAKNVKKKRSNFLYERWITSNSLLNGIKFMWALYNGFNRFKMFSNGNDGALAWAVYNPQKNSSKQYIQGIWECIGLEFLDERGTFREMMGVWNKGIERRRPCLLSGCWAADRRVQFLGSRLISDVPVRNRTPKLKWVMGCT